VTYQGDGNEPPGGGSLQESLRYRSVLFETMEEAGAVADRCWQGRDHQVSHHYESATLIHLALYQTRSMSQGPSTMGHSV